MARRTPQESISVHSIRCPDRAWNTARRRAEAEGYKISGVVTTLLEGYAAGVLHMPEITRSFPVTPQGGSAE